MNGHNIGPILYIFDLQKAYMARNHSVVMKDGKPIIADKILALGREIPGQNAGPSPDFRYKWL